MLVALTGATGLLGSSILDGLNSTPVRVRAIGRSPIGPEFIQADLGDAASVERALTGAEWIVHAAGPPANSADVGEYATMAEAIAKAATVTGARVIHLSSLAVYGASSTRRADEFHECRPISAYGAAKLDAEAAFDRAGVPTCHLRVGNVLTGEDQRDAASSRVRRFVKGNELTNLVFASDVSDVVRFLLLGPVDQLPRVANVVRPDLGSATHGEVFGRQRSNRAMVAPPVVVPHLLRKLSGVPSTRGDTYYGSRLLEDLGFEYAPLGARREHRGSGPTLAGLRILHATASVDRLAGLGPAVRTVDVAEQLAARGATTSIVTLHPRGRAVTRMQRNGVQYTVLPSTLDRALTPRAGLRTMNRLVAGHDVLHLIGHWSLFNVILAALARRRGKPYVVCPAGSLGIYGRSRHLKRVFDLVFGERLIRGASGWIAVVAREIRDFEAHGVDRSQVTIIPNGVETCVTHVATPSSAGHRRPTSRPYVLFLGRLDPIKGPDLLLRAFLSVADSVPFDLVIAGPDYGQLGELERLAAESDVADRVHIVGPITGDQKEFVIAGADALAIPSRREAMSVVVLEAATRGIPVLASTECGLDELLADGAGAVVPPTPPGLASGLLELATMDLEAAGEELRARVRDSYGWDTISELYRDLYARILQSSSTRGGGTR